LRILGLANPSVVNVSQILTHDRALLTQRMRVAYETIRPQRVRPTRMHGLTSGRGGRRCRPSSRRASRGARRSRRCR
jgi:hypothetical protein